MEEVTESGELLGNPRTSEDLSRTKWLKTLLTQSLRVEPSASYGFYREEDILSRYSSRPASDPL